MKQHGAETVMQAGVRALRYPGILATLPHEFAAIEAALKGD